MRDVLELFFTTLAREVVRLEGTVDKYVGDEIMAVFGAPITHEDDAARAVTAAVAMQRAMPALNSSIDPRLSAKLELRIGVNTGEVVSGPLAGGLQDAYTVVGDAVNTAKRIQGAARPGEILVGDLTQRATTRAFDYAPLGPLTAKGKGAPIQTFRYIGPRGAHAKEPVLRSATFVGRATERTALLEAVARLKAGRGGIVGILGDPGIGKSRLLAEARVNARELGVTWLQGHASSYGQNISYLPFREMLRGFAGFDPADDDHTMWSKLERRLGDGLQPNDRDILPYLGTVLAVRLPEDEAERVAELDGDAMRRQVLRSAYVLFDALAREAPTAVVFEDWHWADRSSEGLFTHLLPLADRLLLIFTGRPEANSAPERTVRLARDTAGERYTEIALSPLSSDDSALLICEILGTKSLPGGLRETVVRRAEGNPFFAEEILRAFRELRMLRRDDRAGSWILSDQQDARSLPTTINGVIAARVDRLSEDARDVARAASVIGRTFSYPLLAAVSRGDVDSGLDELLRQSIVRERRAVEGGYAFAHALVQEAVYAGLLMRTRHDLHARVASTLETTLGDRIEENYGVLAYHYARAEQWSKAQHFLFKAGDQALRIAADAEAVDNYELAMEAYARAFGERWDPFERAAAERKIGEARYRLGEFGLATQHLDRGLTLLGFPRPRTRTGIRLAIASELAQQLLRRMAPALAGGTPPPPRVSEAVLQTLWFHQFIDYSSDLERLLYDILRTLNLAERAGPSHRTLRAYFGMTLMCHNIGLRGMASRYAGMAKAMASGIGGTLAGALAAASVGLDAYAVGEWRIATRELAASAAGYRAVGEVEAWAGITGYLNTMLVLQGRLADADLIADDLERTGREVRDRRIEALGPHCRGHVLLWMGHEREAIEEYERALASYREIPDHHLFVAAAGSLARGHLRNGAVESARDLVQEATAVAHDHHLTGWQLTHLLTARAEVLLHEASSIEGQSRAKKLAEADEVCGQLRRQERRHFEAVPPSWRVRGSLEWLRGKNDRAWDAWQRSLDAARQVGALTEQIETHEAIGRCSGSAEDRTAAATIAAQLRASAARRPNRAS